MEKMLNIPELVFIAGLISLLMIKSHFVMMLLFMEMMSLSLYTYIMVETFSVESGILILFLCMMVLEGAFGLTLVINNTRKVGGDFLTSW